MGQKTDTLDVFRQEKLSFSVGVGSEHVFLGLKTRYYFYKNLGVTFSYSAANQFGEVDFNSGLELRLPGKIKKRICPYIFVNYGNDYSIELTYKDQQFNSFIKRDQFYHFMIGSGIKYHLFKNSNAYLTFSLYYKIGQNAKRDAFLEKEKNNIDSAEFYSIGQTRAFFFSLGYTAYIL